MTDSGTAIAPPSPAILKAFEGAFTAMIQRLLTMFAQADAAAAAAIEDAVAPAPANDPLGAVSYAFGPGGAPQTPQTEMDDVRRQNQIAAFKDATGREPVTGTSEIAKIMPQNTSQAGPLLGLPLSQDIGVPLMGGFPDTVLPPLPQIPDLSSTRPGASGGAHPRTVRDSLSLSRTRAR